MKWQSLGFKTEAEFLAQLRVMHEAGREVWATVDDETCRHFRSCGECDRELEERCPEGKALRARFSALGKAGIQ